MKKRDIVLILILISISLFGIIPSVFAEKAGDAYIYVRGNLYGIYDLSVPQSIHIENENGIVNDIEISGNSIYMKNANCTGRQCMACGKISRNKESICCAPSGLLIIVRSQEDPEYDAITE